MVVITSSFGWALNMGQVLHIHLVDTTIRKRGHIILILKMKEPHSMWLSNLSVQLVSEKVGTSVYRVGWRAYGLHTYFPSHYSFSEENDTVTIRMAYVSYRIFAIYL